jgi:predicted CxxxxCH...CXXCH cytochrome family protein
MPQVSLKHGLAALIVSLALFGCSDPNSQSYFNSDTGKHVDNWLPATHMTAANTNLTTCSACHGADFAGGISNVACDLCHMGGATSMHPTGWLRDACFNHGVYALNNGTTACANVYCHGPNLSGVAGSGPSCTKCHTPIPSGGCGSCHGVPPTTGAHVVHTSTPLNYVVCGACHSAGCERHANGTVDIALSTVFYAKSAGTVTFNGTTCSKVSCHGGQTTPNWTGGTINVNTQCTVCHAYGTAEYNSYSSGQHYRHVLDPNNDPRPKLSCTACHDTTKLAVNHFSSLNTPAMEGPASATLLNSLNYNGTSCDPACHGREDWR